MMPAAALRASHSEVESRGSRKQTLSFFLLPLMKAGKAESHILVGAESSDGGQQCRQQGECLTQPSSPCCL